MVVHHLVDRSDIRVLYLLLSNIVSTEIAGGPLDVDVGITWLTPQKHGFAFRCPQLRCADHLAQHHSTAIPQLLDGVRRGFRGFPLDCGS